MSNDLKVVITEVDGYSVKALEVGTNKILEMQKSKFGDIASQEIKKGVQYSIVITDKNGTIWLNSATEVKDKELPTAKADAEFHNADDKFVKLVASTNAMENKQLLIMAQSCQHDAAQIVSTGIDMKNYGSVQELAQEICDLRDALLKDLVEKYYK